MVTLYDSATFLALDHPTTQSGPNKIGTKKVTEWPQQDHRLAPTRSQTGPNKATDQPQQDHRLAQTMSQTDQ